MLAMLATALLLVAAVNSLILIETTHGGSTVELPRTLIQVHPYTISVTPMLVALLGLFATIFKHLESLKWVSSKFDLHDCEGVLQMHELT